MMNITQIFIPSEPFVLSLSKDISRRSDMLSGNGIVMSSMAETVY